MQLYMCETKGATTLGEVFSKMAFRTQINVLNARQIHSDYKKVTVFMKIVVEIELYSF